MKTMSSQPKSAWRRFFLVSLLVTLPIFIALWTLNEPLENAIAPSGVVCLELARTLGRQNEVLASWGEPQRLRLAFSIGLDFLFIPALISTLTFACLWVADVSRTGANLGSKLARVSRNSLLTMSVLWIAQNILLASALFGHSTSLSAQIIYWCALFKFTVMGVSVAYVILYGCLQLAGNVFHRAAAAG